MSFPIILSVPEAIPLPKGKNAEMNIAIQTWVTHGKFVQSNTLHPCLEHSGSDSAICWPKTAWPVSISEFDAAASMMVGATFWCKPRQSNSWKWYWAGHFAYGAFVAGPRDVLERIASEHRNGKVNTYAPTRLEYAGFVATIKSAPKMLDLLTDVVKVVLKEPRMGKPSFQRYCSDFETYVRTMECEMPHSAQDRAMVPMFDEKITLGVITSSNDGVIPLVDFIAWRAAAAAFGIRNASWVDLFHTWMNEAPNANAVPT